MSRASNTKWNLVVHYSLLIVNMGSGILLTPLYVKNINIQLYGAWLAVTNIISWLSVVDPGFSNIIQQKVAFNFGNNNKKEIFSFIMYGLLTALVFSVIVYLLGYIAVLNLDGLLKFSGSVTDITSLKQCFHLATIGTAFTIFCYSLGSATTGLQYLKSQGFFSVLINLFSLVLIFVLLQKQYALYAIAYGALFRGLGYFSFNSILLVYALKREKIPITLSFSGFKGYLKSLGFNYLGSVCNLLNNNISSFFIARNIDSAIVPTYTLSKNAYDISSTLMVRPSMAIMPAYTHLLGEGNQQKAQQVFANFIKYFFWGLGIMSCGLLLFNQSFVNLWVGSAYFGGLGLNVLLCIAAFLLTITNSLSNFLISFGSFKKNNISIFIQTLVFIPLFFGLMEIWGLSGVVLAQIISLLAFPFWHNAKQVYKLTQLPKQLIQQLLKEAKLVGVVVLLTAILFYYWRISSTWLGFGVKGLLMVLVYFISLYVLSASFNQIIKSRLQKFKLLKTK